MNRYTFDLENAIRTWRGSLATNRTFSKEDLDELERHLRDEVAEAVRTGEDPESAFRRARSALGQYHDIETEYRKVWPGKVKRTGRIREEVAWHAALAASSVRIALRDMRRHPGFSAINLLGLAAGLACFLLISMYVVHQSGFDGMHDDADRIYRLNWDFQWDNGEGTAPGSPPPLAAAVVDAVPDVESAVRLYKVGSMAVRPVSDATGRMARESGAARTASPETRLFNEDGIVAADSTFFEIFDFDLTEGDPAAALTQPNSVVLTEERARTYFGSESPLGRTVVIGQDSEFLGRPYSSTFTVTGVVKDPPAQSHIQFDLLTSSSSHPEIAFFDWSWIWMQVATYVRLSETASPGAVQAAIQPIVAANAPASFERLGFSFQEMIAGGGHWDFLLQRLDEVYLGGVGNNLGPSGDRTYVRVFGAIALLILLMACFNYTNLSTARSMGRTLEIGVRKALGSKRSTVLAQFLTESVVYALFALVLAIGFVFLLFDPFEQLTGVAVDPVDLASPGAAAALIGLVVATGLLAGMYPGAVLSSFSPVGALQRGRSGEGRNGGFLRRGLVVFQFTLTIALIVAALLARDQIEFMQTADYGFDRAGVLVVSNADHRLGERTDAYRSRLAAWPEISSVSVSTGVPPHCCFDDYYTVEGRGDEQFTLSSYMTDDAFLETMGIQLVAGRDFERGRANDARSIIVNETAVRTFRWENPIGRTVDYPGMGTFEVIGVMEDFYPFSLKFPLGAMALFHESSEAYEVGSSFVLVRAEAGDAESVLERARRTWEDIAPDAPFDYEFIDESFAQVYTSDRRLARLLRIFAIPAILIACLGVLGLAALAAARRTREIGVRKAMGATTGRILGLLTREFALLAVVSFIPAALLARFAVAAWLDGFANRTAMDPWAFVAGGMMALVLALGATVWHAWRAARMNPAVALRES